MTARRSGAGERGRGFLGFLVAIVVVGFLGNAMWQFYSVKSKRDRMDDFAYSVLGDAERLKWNEEKVKFELLKKAKELGITRLKAQAIQVSRDNVRWQLHLEWDDTIKIPGFRREVEYTIDKSFTRF